MSHSYPHAVNVVMLITFNILMCCFRTLISTQTHQNTKSLLQVVAVVKVKVKRRRSTQAIGHCLTRHHRAIPMWRAVTETLNTSLVAHSSLQAAHMLVIVIHRGLHLHHHRYTHQRHGGTEGATRAAPLHHKLIIVQRLVHIQDIRGNGKKTDGKTSIVAIQTMQAAHDDSSCSPLTSGVTNE